MPIYEYTCQKCGAHLEVMQKITDKPRARHSSCGGKLEKEWSRTGFQFKGSGWYVTDYAGRKTDAKEGKDKPDAKESKESKTDSSEPKATTESKTATTKESKGSKPSSTTGSKD
ncbi:MAG TPA: FmdB family zinc ribbon protein [Pyrinomonadaceae bacterium]|nr:FmdB family zinc ribbon protein [Pyrinomonadaceae bacterium]